MAFKGNSTIGITPATPCTGTVIGITISALTIKKKKKCIFRLVNTKRIAAEEFLDENLMKIDGKNKQVVILQEVDI